MASRKLVVEVVGDSASFERSLTRATATTKRFDRQFSSATRGVAAGSGVFKSLGRTLAFASGGFLAFGGASAFIRKTIDAARDAAVTQAQLATQLRNDGKAFSDYRDQIDKTISRLSALAGIEDDELKSALTTILRTVPNVSQALRDLATATNLARARHISLAQAATIIAKTEAGNTTLLRRQGFQIAKNATAEQALAALRLKVAGQARAGTTEQERFGATLHNTEEIIGTGLLPVLNQYLASGTRWLQQMNESGKLQRDVAKTAHGVSDAVHVVADAVKAADKVTGSFTHTLEILAELRIALGLARIADSVGLIGTRATTAEGEVIGLRAALGRLAATRLAPIAIPLALELIPKSGSGQSALDKEHAGFLGHLPVIGGLATQTARIGADSKRIGNAVADAIFGKPQSDGGQVGTSPAAEAAAKAAAGRAREKAQVIDKAVADALKKSHALNLTAAQRNTFFDNAIARILLRGGLGDVQQQIAALEKADALIAERLKVTKDVTRRLNLEDELLQNQAKIRDLKAQQAAAAIQAAADAHQKAVDALARAAAARNARQFKALGLTATGDDRAPSVRQLRNAVGSFEDTVTGTFLDTNKTRSVLASLRKVLSGGLGVVGRDVRLKVQDILRGLNQQLDQNTAVNLTKWRHLSTQAFLAGVPDLTPAQRRQLAARLSTLGPGAVVPGVSSPALALNGASHGADVITLNIDGHEVTRVVTSRQRKRAKKRTLPRGV